MPAVTVGEDDLSIAVAHWHVNAWGGAEYLVTKLAESLETEIVHTLGMPSPKDPNPYGDIEWVDVTGGPAASVKRRLGRPGEYALWEDVDWRDHGDPDVIISSGATTRAVITADDTLHVNYCHSTPRWFYDLYHDRKDSLTGKLTRPILRYLRLWDQAIDTRVDYYFANSPVIARRLWKYYKRDSEVLYPPIELEKYRNEGEHGYYLHLGRLDSEKGVPHVVEAFDGLDERLIFAGGRGDVSDGVIETIEESGNMEWRGFVTEEEKVELLSMAKAVVFNGVNEDFGIVPIEANASGKPVLARREGFPRFFVEEGINGYFHDGSPESIRNSLNQFESNGVGSNLQQTVKQFSIDEFENQLEASIQNYQRSLQDLADLNP